MKCKYCGEDFSFKVHAIHEENCDKKEVKEEKKAPKKEVVKDGE